MSQRKQHSESKAGDEKLSVELVWRVWKWRELCVRRRSSEASGKKNRRKSDTDLTSEKKRFIISFLCC